MKKLGDDLETLRAGGEAQAIQAAEVNQDPPLGAQGTGAIQPLICREDVAQLATRPAVYSPRLIFSCSNMIPSINISGRGGQPGT